MKSFLLVMVFNVGPLIKMNHPSSNQQGNSQR
jgi:hypothetical protein